MLHRSIVLTLLLLGCLCGPIAVCGRTMAQGFEPDAPDPISTLRLRLLLGSTVPLDDPRWVEIEERHQAYLSQYMRELRPRLEAHTTSTLEVVRNERAFEEFRRINASMDALEERLLTDLSAFLGDEAAGEVAVARTRRARERLTATLRWDGAGVSVADALRSIVRDEARLRPLESELQSYDEATRAALQRAREKFDDAKEAGYVAVREAKLPRPNAAAPGQVQGQFQEQSREWHQFFFESGTRQREEGLAFLAKANERDLALIAKVRSHLTPTELRALRWRTLSPHTTEIHSAAWIDVLFQLALHAPEIDANARAEATKAYEAWVAEQEKAIDEIAAIDRRTPEGLAAVQVRQQEMHKASRDRANAYLSGTEAWVTPIRERWTSIVNGTFPDELPVFDTEALLAIPMRGEIDIDRRLMPKAITGRTIDVLATRLGLDEQDRATLTTMHRDWEERWNQASASWWARIVKIERGPRTIVEDRVVPITEGIDHLVNERMRVLEEADVLDGQFFKSVAAAFAHRVTEETAHIVELLQLSRALEIRTVGSWEMYLPEHAILWPVDVVEVGLSVALDDDNRRTLELALLAHGPAAVAAATKRARGQAGISERHEAFFLGYEDAARRVVEGEAPTPDEERDAAAKQAAEQEARDEAWTRAIDDRLAGDRETLELFRAAIAGLPDAATWALRAAYARKAMPEYFGDCRAIDGLLDRARGIKELGEDRTHAIEALMQAYERTRTDIADQLMDRRARPLEAKASEFIRTNDRRAAEARIIFERDEQSARAVGVLRRLLTPDERERVPGLDTYERRVEIRRRVFVRSAS